MCNDKCVCVFLCVCVRVCVYMCVKLLKFKTNTFVIFKSAIVNNINKRF